MAKALRSLRSLHSLNKRKSRVAHDSEANNTKPKGSTERVPANIALGADVVTDAPPNPPQPTKKRKTLGKRSGWRHLRKLGLWVGTLFFRSLTPQLKVGFLTMRKLYLGWPLRKIFSRLRGWV